MKKFNKEFLLGAATSAYQTEGNNENSDCWLQEHMKTTSYTEKSGAACDSYNRYQEDIIYLKNAGLNAYRFSIEWSRIEPQDGVFDEQQMQHYIDVVSFCKKNGIEPIVTLHHFSSPVWLIRKGGWEAESTVDDFAKYASYVMTHLNGMLRYVCTINEANMGIQIAAIAKRYMAKMNTSDSNVQLGLNFKKMMQERQLEQAKENMQVFGTSDPAVFMSSRTQAGDMIVIKAHQAAVKAIHEIDPDIKVGLTLSLHDVQSIPGGEAEAEKIREEEFLHYLPYIQDDDFLGVQNYTRTLVGPEGQLPVPNDARQTEAGYEFDPEAVSNVVRFVAKSFHNEMIVTENGVASSDDKERIEFLEKALDGIERCVNDDIPLKGYLCWSLLDNYEWQKGFSMHFGLIAVNRKTMERTPKPSLTYLGSRLK